MIFGFWMFEKRQTVRGPKAMVRQETSGFLLAIVPESRAIRKTERLLTRWGALHAVRSALSGAALLLFLYLLVFK
jgi:hypothetical protein